VNGCHDELSEPVAIYDGTPFTRCPRAMVDADALYVLDLVAEDYLKAVGPREARRLPAKLVAAIQHVKDALPEREVDGG
jgi:hypothetical protein